MVKFAVTREDPQLEVELAQQRVARRALVAAVGGDTPLALKHALPDCEVHAFDPDPLQLAHVHHKQLAIAQGRLADLNVDNLDPEALSQCGEVERLFRVLRAALLELVVPPLELEDFFARPDPELVSDWAQGPLWAACFEAAFTDALVEVFFGPGAHRLVAKGGYPRAFQQAFERGLSQPGGAANPFFQHVLLQRYLDPPPFLRAKRLLALQLHEGPLTAVPELETFDLVSLSRHLDTATEAEVDGWAKALHALKPGSLVVWRQLANAHDWAPRFAPDFVEEQALGHAWTARERTGLYEKVTILRRA